MKSLELSEYLNFEFVVMQNKNVVLEVIFDFKAYLGVIAIQDICKSVIVCHCFHFKNLVRKKLKIKFFEACTKVHEIFMN